MKTVLKKWTVLIYANGNNDLEPEIWQTMLTTEMGCFNNNVNILFEIGREDRALMNIFRPRLVLPKQEGEWMGVRRYLLKDRKSVLLHDFGKKNMADPYSLYQFVKDGMERFPAEHYMVVLGGHGYQFVGSMPDYSQEAPYIMGFPEMADALDKACAEAGQKIALLVADICYFNFIEVIYEFAKHTGHGVQNVLTYICDGPICGMPYAQIINNLQNPFLHCIHEVIQGLIKNLNLDLVAFTLDHAKLESVKQVFHRLAETYTNTQPKSKLNVSEILFSTDSQLPWHRIAGEAIRGLEGLVIDYKRISHNDYGLLNIANTPVNHDKLNSFYTKLSFTKNNAWTSLLVKPSFIQPVRQQVDTMAPLQLAPEEVYAYVSIMNPQLTSEEKIDILKNLVVYKGWVFSNLF
jgi:Clostripain family.